MTDHQLAAFCYGKAGINIADYEEHWQQDSHKGKLRVAVRTAYLKIYNSYFDR